MRRPAIALAAAALILHAARRPPRDLVVWWEKGFYPQEDEAVREIVAAFEQKTGKQVELVQPSLDQILNEAERPSRRGGRPIFLEHHDEGWYPRWAYEDRLADLGGALGPVLDLFDADAIEVSTLLNGKTGRRGLYALPMGRYSNHVHVWSSLLERAGFTLDDIPKDWEAFWSFWCDKVQPKVRQALGRDDIWGVGLPMSAQASLDTQDQLVQFQLAYDAPWVGRDGVLQLDDAAARAGLSER